MRIYKIIGVALVFAGVLTLVGCHKQTPAMGSAGHAGQIANNDDQSARSYAMSQQKGYQGRVQHNAQGQVINPLRAPANQTYYFDYDSNKVHSNDFRALNVQANYLASHPSAKVRLEGNTDNRGSREYNIGLGWRRDQSVTRLLEQQGVRPSQIDMVSYGKERPVVLGDNARAWQLNRRVHLVYEAY